MQFPNVFWLISHFGTPGRPKNTFIWKNSILFFSKIVFWVALSRARSLKAPFCKLSTFATISGHLNMGHLSWGLKKTNRSNGRYAGNAHSDLLEIVDQKVDLQIFCKNFKLKDYFHIFYLDMYNYTSNSTWVYTYVFTSDYTWVYLQIYE